MKNTIRTSALVLAILGSIAGSTGALAGASMDAWQGARNDLAAKVAELNFALQSNAAGGTDNYGVRGNISRLQNEIAALSAKMAALLPAAQQEMFNAAPYRGVPATGSTSSTPATTGTTYVPSYNPPVRFPNPGITIQLGPSRTGSNCHRTGQCGNPGVHTKHVAKPQNNVRQMRTVARVHARPMRMASRGGSRRR
jgi:hypothetical protein